MAEQQRRRFLTQNDWYNFLNELKSKETPPNINLYKDLRVPVYKEIEKERNRPLLIYATKFINTPPNSKFISIDLTDIDGFTDLVSSIDQEHNTVDILLHSPGGSPDATERIVNCIRNRFEDVTFLIPHSAYSAATMMALSGNKIILHPSATLGPIDPQINGTPARAIIRGFNNVRDLIQAEGPSIVPAYLPMLKQLTLQFLEQCKDAEELSKLLAKDWLMNYMYKNKEAKEEEIDELVEFLTKYDDHKIHSRPIFFDKIKDFHIEVEKAEGELSRLMREAHILLNGFFDVTTFVKIYENSTNMSFGRQINQNLKNKKTTEEKEKSD